MPRDGSGNYTLPVNSVDPAVTNTTINPTDFNSTMNDLSTEIQDSLDRSGKGAMLAALAMGGFKVQNVGAPSASTDALRLTDIGGTVFSGTTGSGSVVLASTLSSVIESVAVQSFSTSGTYTPNAKMALCLVECWGGGGGGGGTALTAAGNTSQGGGGAGGGYARALLTAAQIGASKAVTVPTASAGGGAGNNPGTAGGTVSLGTLCVAAGGAGGNGSDATAHVINSVGGGAGSTGDCLFAGGDGDMSIGVAGAVFYPGGSGGESPGGGGRTSAFLQSGGHAGKFPGGGGSGGNSVNASLSVAGGAGATGYVTIREFLTG
jgi:hypothetical protein